MDEDTTHGEETADGGFGPTATVTPGSDTSGTPMAETKLAHGPSAAVPDVSDPAATSASEIGQAAPASLDGELRAGAEAEREGFELRLAGCRSVKAARALLPDFGGDVDALAAAEPWLFGAETAPAGVTGLPSAGAAGGGDEAETARWREIAGLE